MTAYKTALTNYRKTLVDREVNAGLDKRARIDIGLVLLQRRAQYGEPLTIDDQAAWTGSTPENMRQIFNKAMRKVRIKIQRDYPELIGSIGEVLNSK